jgi:hypothetical protein
VDAVASSSLQTLSTPLATASAFLLHVPCYFGANCAAAPGDDIFDKYVVNLFLVIVLSIFLTRLEDAAKMSS